MYVYVYIYIYTWIYNITYIIYNMASMGYLYISGFIDENITITRTVRLIGSKL